MIVRCENCGTEFGFDDRQIGEGVTVRCSVCKHVFKVVSPSASPQSWQIRTTEDMSFKAPDVATLREWIDEGRLHPDDQVSRTGRNWVRLGDMPEFARAFAAFQGLAPVAEPVRAADPTPAAAQPQPSTTPQPPSTPETSSPTRAAVLALDDDDDEDALLVDDEDEPPAAPITPPPAPQPARTREPSKPQQQAEPPKAPPPQPEPPADQREAAPEPLDLPSDADEDDDEDEGGKRRGVGAGLIALLGVVTAVGVMFGVPSIRTKLLSLGQDRGGEASLEPQRVAEIQAAEQAMQTLGMAALARAEADLQRALDAGDADPATTAAMKVALAELHSSRALAYEIAAALDAAQREDFRRRAADDQADGKRLIDRVQAAPDIDRLAEVRALARLAAGRAEAEVLPLVPEGAAETRLIVQAAVLWQDLAAPVPSGLVAGLSELRERSGLGASALALALVRAGDAVAARNLAERLLVGAEDQIVALAVRSHLEQSGSPGEGETEGEPSEGETGGAGEGEGESETGPAESEPVAKAPPRPGEPAGEGGGGGGASFDKLVERGCSQVRGGQAAAGIKTLLRAFDIKANNLDVLVCLGDGYAAQGQTTQAATFYDRALKQSPANIPALRGAAKLAAKTGAEARAKRLYERLLAADPNNAAAQAYLAKHGGGQEAPSEPAPDPDTPPSD